MPSNQIEMKGLMSHTINQCLFTNARNTLSFLLNLRLCKSRKVKQNEFGITILIIFTLNFIVFLYMSFFVFFGFLRFPKSQRLQAVSLCVILRLMCSYLHVIQSHVLR